MISIGQGGGRNQSTAHPRKVSILVMTRSTVSDKSKDGLERRKKRWREKIGGSFSVSRRRRRLILRQAQDDRVSPGGGSSFDKLRMSFASARTSGCACPATRSILSRARARRSGSI